MPTLPAPKVKIKELLESGQTTLITENTTPEKLFEITDQRVEKLWGKVSSPTNNPRMLLQSEKETLPYHIVYKHVDEEGTIVYIGNGIFGRDGDCLARRAAEHSKWMLQQCVKGLIMQKQSQVD